MASSNVRDIESLEAFHAALVGLASEWERTLQEVRLVTQRAEDHFVQERPAYWRRQIKLAERALNEAKDQLAQKRSVVRASDRLPATEANKRVQRAERRLRDCEAKSRAAKAWSLDISRRCEQVLGPLADVVEQCEVLLPTAAVELRELIEQLRAYAQQHRPPTNPS